MSTASESSEESMVWRSGRAASAGASRGGGASRVGASASCEARVSSSESQPVRPPPAVSTDARARYQHEGARHERARFVFGADGTGKAGA